MILSMICKKSIVSLPKLNRFVFHKFSFESCIYRGYHQEVTGDNNLSPVAFKKLCKFIVQFLSRYRLPLHYFPLHEAFYYDQYRPLQEVFIVFFYLFLLVF